MARGLAPRESAGATVGLAIASMDIVRIKRADPRVRWRGSSVTRRARKSQQEKPKKSQTLVCDWSGPAVGLSSLRPQALFAKWIAADCKTPV